MPRYDSALLFRIRLIRESSILDSIFSKKTHFDLYANRLIHEYIRYTGQAIETSREQCRDPMSNVLRVGKPVEGVLHMIRNMTQFVYVHYNTIQLKLLMRFNKTSLA